MKGRLVTAVEFFVLLSKTNNRLDTAVNFAFTVKKTIFGSYSKSILMETLVLTLAGRH